MRYKLLGRTGLRVSEAALGTGTFGTAWGWGADREVSRTMFDAFGEAGGNFIDTAGGYQNGDAESFVGEFIKADRASFVVSTKYSGPANGTPAMASVGNSRKAMMHGLEQSLKRLGTDYVDIFMVHFADGVTPVEEMLRGFEDLVAAGKINYAGISDFPAWRIARAATLAELARLPFAAIQIEYSLAERSAERELLPMAEGIGLGVTLWSVLGGGLLSGKYRGQGAEGRQTHGGGTVRTEQGERDSRVLDAIQSVASGRAAKPAQVAIAWVRAKGAARKTAVIPIIGARTLAQFTENLGALELDLTSEEVARLDEASAIPLGFPHEMLSGDMIDRIGFLGKGGLVDRPAGGVA